MTEIDPSQLEQFNTILSELLSRGERSQKQQLELPPITSESSTQRKREALQETLRALSNIEPESAFDKYNVEEVIDFFCRLYGGEKPYRHLYSDICHVMYDYLGKDSELDDGVPFETVALANNMEMIHREIDGREHVDSEIKKCVYKLYDHIELENTRMRYMAKQNKAQIEKSKKLQADVDSFHAKIEETQDALQRNYVTILGIFAAIVIAFVAGTSFSSSVLQNMAGVSIYRLSFVMLSLGLVLFDLVLTLYFFICRVSRFEEGEHLPTIAKWVNVILVILIAAIIFAWKLQLLN